MIGMLLAGSRLSIGPDTVSLLGFLGLGALCVLETKRRNIRRAAELASPKSEPELNQDLDQICQQIIENNHMMKKFVDSSLGRHSVDIIKCRIIAQEVDKPDFVQAVMNKLKHETFPPGTPLTTIGVWTRTDSFITMAHADHRKLATTCFFLRGER